MYKITPRTPTSILRTEIKIGETIEQKVTRLKDNEEPITDATRLIYTDYKDGVKPEYDIRTDKWDIAMTERDKTARNMAAKITGAMEEKNSGTEATTGTSDADKSAEK